MSSRTLARFRLPLTLLLCLGLGGGPWAAASPHDFTNGGGDQPGGPDDDDDDDPCGDEGGDPIMLYNGRFTLDRRDLFVPGRMMDVDITMRYASGNAYNGPYGYKWDMSYNRHLRIFYGGDVILKSHTGYEFKFTYIPSTDSYESPTGLFKTLVANPDGTYHLQGIHGDYEVYDMNGSLVQQFDRFGNHLTFYYSDKKMPVYGYISGSGGVVGVTVIVAFDYVLQKIEDEAGREIEFFYNEDTRLVSMDFDGQSITYAYDSEGINNLMSVTYPGGDQYPGGLTVSYTYDWLNCLETITDPKGQTYLANTYSQGTITGRNSVVEQTFGEGTYTLDYAPSGDGRATTVTDPRGVVTTSTFDSTGLLIKEEIFTDGVPASEPFSYVTTFDYNSDRRVIRIVYPRGNAVEFEYDGYGQVTEIRRRAIGSVPGVVGSADLVTSVTYEPEFNLIKSITLPDGNSTELVYDYEMGEASLGMMRKIIHPSSASSPPETVVAYNGFGQVLSITDANGLVTEPSYDAASGYVSSLAYAVGSPVEMAQSFAFDTSGNLTLFGNANGDSWTFHYDARGLLREKTSPGPRSYRTLYRYDENGNLTQMDREVESGIGGTAPALGTVHSADGWQSSVLTYNSLDSATSLVDDLGNAASFSADELGQGTEATDALGRQTQFAYDERGMVWKITEPDGSSSETYTYDENGNRTGLEDGNGNLTVFVFDDFDRLTSKVYPDGSFAAASYDEMSRITSITKPSGDVITFSYDDASNLVAKSTPTDSFSFEYDPGGRMTRAVNGAAESLFTFDEMGRLIEEHTTLSAGFVEWTVAYSHDAVGNVTEIVYPDGSGVARSYDAMARLKVVTPLTPLAPASAVALPGGGALRPDVIARYSYDGLDRQLSRSLPGGIQTDSDYDTSVVGVNNMSHSVAGVLLSEREYEYDACGSRVSMTDGYGLQEYTVDERGQLEGVDYPVAHTFSDTSFVYDAAGNRTSTSDGVVTGYSVNELNQYTSVGGSPQVHDGNGNLSAYAGTTYVHDAEGRLLEVQTGAGTATYSYGPLGRRLAKTVGGVSTYFVHDRLNVIEELNSAGDAECSYVYGANIDEALRLTRGGQTYYYLADSLRSVSHLLDASGQVVEQYLYDAYGQVEITDESGGVLADSAYGNPLQFTGNWRDTESELIFLRLRSYDPSTGRFLERDPLGYEPDQNLYRYVYNAPTDFSDPFGLWAGIDDLIFAGGGALISVLAQGGADLLNWEVSSVSTYVSGALGGAAAGETLLYTGNPFLAGAVGGAVSNGSSQLMDMAGGKRKSFDFVGLALDTGLGAAAGLIPGTPKTGAANVVKQSWKKPSMAWVNTRGGLRSGAGISSNRSWHAVSNMSDGVKTYSTGGMNKFTDAQAGAAWKRGMAAYAGTQKAKSLINDNFGDPEDCP